MAITKYDVKLMASQKLTDDPDGGGRMTGIEVVDGNVNNLFPDKSRLDCVVGRVSIREAFQFIDTDNADPYYGAHAILTDPAQDPLVHICMFQTGDPWNYRSEARNYIESYVTQGPRYSGYLWGTQVEGARAISIFQLPGTITPGVGDVLYLATTGGANYQFVRITKITITPASATGSAYEVMVCELSDPLRYDFVGYEFDSPSKTNQAMVYKTLVSDAAKYYGVMRLTAAIIKNDVSINVDSIYTHLVPSAQTETPMVDQSVGIVPAMMRAAADAITIGATLTVAPGGTLHLPVCALPDSLTFNANGQYFHTAGTKVIYNTTGAQIGTIDHASGLIQFDNSFATILSGAAGTMTFIPALGETRIGCNKALPVLLSNRGYNYVTSLHPLPAPGSIQVSYRVQGKWYALQDDGAGFLRGIAGSGSCNYGTGGTVITCGALPDADSCILLNWAQPMEYTSRQGLTGIETPAIEHTVAGGSINPGSLSISWLSGGLTKTITDDGNGGITPTNVATGFVIYATGKIKFRPLAIPDTGTEFAIASHTYAKQLEGIASQTGTFTFQLSAYPITPGSLSISVDYTGGGYTTTLLITDDGAGHLNVAPFSLNYPLGHPVEESSGGCSSSSSGGSSSSTNHVASSGGSTDIVPMPTGGTINYATGECVLHGMGQATVKWITRTQSTSNVVEVG